MIKKIIISILLLSPLLVSAHATGGTLEKTEGEYFIDIGFSEPIVYADSSVRFDFNVFKGANRDDVDYNNVWVKFVKDGELVFVGTLPRPKFSAGAMTFTFPRGGDYELTTIFQKDSQSVVQSVQYLTVSPEQDSQPAKNTDSESFGSRAVIFLIGLFLGILIQVISSLLRRNFFTKGK